MEPADIMKISMTVAEAKKEMEKIPMDQSPESHRKRSMGNTFATAIRGYGLTPAQAQAALVLAWNEVLSTVKFSFPDSEDC